MEGALEEEVEGEPEVVVGVGQEVVEEEEEGAAVDVEESGAWVEEEAEEEAGAAAGAAAPRPWTPLPWPSSLRWASWWPRRDLQECGRSTRGTGSPMLR